MRLSPLPRAPGGTQTYEAEAARLANALRPRKAGTTITESGWHTTYRDISGFHVEDCDARILKNYLLTWDGTAAHGLAMFVLRVYCVRFPREFDQLRRQHAVPQLANEMELVASEASRDAAFMGRVGYLNQARLDGSNHHSHKRTITKRNGFVETVDR